MGRRMNEMNEKGQEFDFGTLVKEEEMSSEEADTKQQGDKSQVRT